MFSWCPLLEHHAVMLPIEENARLGHKVNFAPGKIPLQGKIPKNVYSVPAQEMSDVGAVTKPRCETSRNLLVCPQTRQPISATNGPKFTILWGHVDEILLFNRFFLIVDTCLSCEDIAWQIVRWCEDGEFLRPVFSASLVQHISDLHYKIALRPHHVWKYSRHLICDR